MKGQHEPIPDDGRFSQDLRILLQALVQPAQELRPDTSAIVAEPFLQVALVDTQFRVGMIDK